MMGNHEYREDAAPWQRWVDDLRDQEEPPEGLDLEVLAQIGEDDRLSLVGSLQSLKQETALQGRAFKDLSHKIQALLEVLQSESRDKGAITSEEAKRPDATGQGPRGPDSRSQGAAGASNTGGPETRNQDAEGLARALEASRNQGKVDLVTEVLDVRDRLERGLRDARARLAEIRGVRGWFTDRSVLEAVVEGLALSLAGFDDLLGRQHVRPVPVIQGGFDPTTMRAVEIEERSDVPDGNVLEVIRQGYYHGDRLLRPAEVKVCRGKVQDWPKALEPGPETSAVDESPEEESEEDE